MVNLATTLVFLAYGQNLLVDLLHPVCFTLILAWLLHTILFSLFVVVRHAENLAVILPLAVILKAAVKDAQVGCKTYG